MLKQISQNMTSERIASGFSSITSSSSVDSNCQICNGIGFLRQDLPDETLAMAEVRLRLTANETHSKFFKILKPVQKTQINSTNLVFSQWVQIFKDLMTTTAPIDRVVHHTILVCHPNAHF